MPMEAEESEKGVHVVGGPGALTPLTGFPPRTRGGFLSAFAMFMAALPLRVALPKVDTWGNGPATCSTCAGPTAIRSRTRGRPGRSRPRSCTGWAV